MPASVLPATTAGYEYNKLLCAHTLPAAVGAWAVPECAWRRACQLPQQPAVSRGERSSQARAAQGEAQIRICFRQCSASIYFIEVSCTPALSMTSEVEVCCMAAALSCVTNINGCACTRSLLIAHPSTALFQTATVSRGKRSSQARAAQGEAQACAACGTSCDRRSVQSEERLANSLHSSEHCCSEAAHILHVTFESSRCYCGYALSHKAHLPEPTAGAAQR
jgi:hypothetical protein